MTTTLIQVIAISSRISREEFLSYILCHTPPVQVYWQNFKEKEARGRTTLSEYLVWSSSWD
jgi:uncharacterized membrane protein YhaH (DUF805 family)